jgi:hypothetical protein
MFVELMMPTYEFIDTDNQEIFERMMSISAKEDFLKEHPNIQQIHTQFPGMVSGIGFEKKQDSGWKENLQRIAEAHPNSPLADKIKGKSAKEVKIDELKKKHGLGQGISTL